MAISSSSLRSSDYSLSMSSSSNFRMVFIIIRQKEMV